MAVKPLDQNPEPGTLNAEPRNPERISIEFLHGSNIFSNYFSARTAGSIGLTAKDII